MTQWFCDELIKGAFNRDTYTPAYTTLAVVLTRQVPAINTAPAALDRPTASEYVDVTVPLNTANWTLTGLREVYNTYAITWPTIVNYWGVLNGWAVVTTGTVNQTVAVGRLTSAQRGNIGVTPTAPAGSLMFGVYES